MSTRTIFISNKSQAVIVCDKCGETKAVDIEPIALRGKPVHVRCKHCGHSFDVVFDTRTRYRKDTALKGHYLRKDPAGDQLGRLTISDLSMGGLRFEATGKDVFVVGDMLTVEFRLDDTHKTSIRTDVVVKSVMDRDIGVEFVALDEHMRKLLGFYLLP